MRLDEKMLTYENTVVVRPGTLEIRDISPKNGIRINVAPQILNEVHSLTSSSTELAPIRCIPFRQIELAPHFVGSYFW
jgi:hypothetical protein